MAHKPKSLTWAQAGGTPLSSLTAWQGLFTQGTLDKRALHGDEEARAANARQRVLITGASGSVGVGNPAGAVPALKFGATETIDYTTTALDAWAAADPAARECDLVLDCVGGPSLGNCWAAVKTGGTFVSTAGTPEEVRPAGNTKAVAKAEWFLVESLGSDLEEIGALVEAGTCVPLIDSVYEFEDFAAAFERVAVGRPSGKVVINVSA
ncbi:hypothetical protein G7046_g9898 [Stylonectria norvegica]|nr:hypothetical protein G7046_g9898 [Stylonectria norvegica]